MKEVDCGMKHHGILEAIEHARKNLSLTREKEHPLLGTNGEQGPSHWFYRLHRQEGLAR